MNPGGTFSSRAVGWIVALALLAYPRGFRRRFGDEMRTDVRRHHRRARCMPSPPSAILVLVLRQGLVLVGVGTAIGVAGALATTRYLESLLHGVAPRDPRTLGAVVVLFVLVALAASYLPARRASAIDPLDALRHE